MGPPRWYRDLLEDLSHLLRAGIPILEALDNIAAEKTGRRGDLARHLAARVRSGSTLGEAMAGSPEIPEEHAALAEAGEQSGTLVKVLEKIIERMDRKRQAFSQFLSRVTYPVVILVLAVMALPLYLLVNDEGRLYVLIQVLFFGAAACVAGIVLFGPSLLARHASLRESLERLALRLPWLGRAIADGGAGRALGLLGLLQGAGLSLGAAFGLVAKSTRLGFISDAFRSLEPRLMAGMTLAEALRADAFFAREPAWIGRIAAAEKAGALEKTLIDLGDQLEANAQARIETALRVLPYLLLPLVGALVLWRAIGLVSTLHGGL